MGIFDDMKKAAATVAGEVKEAGKAVGDQANRAGRIAQAQVKLRSLQNDQATAEKELGQAAFALAEQGMLPQPELQAAVARVREAQAAVAAKAAEIEAIKAEETGGPAPTDAAATASASDTSAPETAAEEALQPDADAPGGPPTSMPGT